MLRAVSDSKIRCEPLSVSQSKVSRTEPQCSPPSYTATVASLRHTLFTGKQQQLTAQTIKVYCYHLDRGVSLIGSILFLFFSLRKEYYDCNGADPELKMPLGADPKWAASLKTTTHRHLIVTECEVVHWANTPLIHREKAVTFKVRPKPQVPSTTSHTHRHTHQNISIPSMHNKVLL